MKQVLYGLLGVLMATGVLSGTVRAADVAEIPGNEARSINTNNGANIGGDANTVSGTGRGAGGPGDGEGPGNGAGQGIGNGPSKNRGESSRDENESSRDEDESSSSLVSNQTFMSSSSSMSASPAPEPATLVLVGGVGSALLVAYWFKRRSSKVSEHTA